MRRADFALSITRMMFVVTMLIGGFSLARLNEDYEWLGMFGQVRYWLLAGLAVVLFLRRPSGRRGQCTKTASAVFVAACAVLHAFVAVSILWSADPVRGATKLPDLVATIASVAIARRLWRDDPVGGTEYLLYASYAVSVALLLIGAVLTGTIVGEVGGVGAGAIGTARLYGTAVVAAVYLWLAKQRPLALIPLPFWVMGIFASGSRASALATLVAAALVASKLSKNLAAMWVRPRVLITTVTLIAIFVSLSQTPIAHEFADQFSSSFWKASPLGSDELYYADRDELALEAIGIIRDNPLFGLGLGTYVAGCCGFVGSSAGADYPHNLALNIGVDCGMIGLMLFAWLILVGFRRTNLRSDQVQRAAFGAAILHVGVSMLAGSYYDARFVWIFWVLMIMTTESRTVVLCGTSGTKTRAAILHSVPPLRLSARVQC